MADTTLAITAGSGTPMKTTTVDSSTNHVQYVRDLQADANAAPGSWTLSTTASTSLYAADQYRLGVLLVNNGTGRIYMRFDSTAPTVALHNWWLDPGDRWEVPPAWCRLTASFIAATGASGVMMYSLGTKA